VFKDLQALIANEPQTEQWFSLYKQCALITNFNNTSPVPWQLWCDISKHASFTKLGKIKRVLNQLSLPFLLRVDRHCMYGLTNQNPILLFS
jgi:hypothetical protein